MAEVRESYGFALSVAALTDVGRVRTNNEDSHGYAWLNDGSLFVIVCDGMGGHEAGEVASGLAVQVVEEVVTRDPEQDPRDRLYSALLEANRAILEEGSRSGTRGMGTTAISALFRGQQVYVGLIGDSRCYQFRRGQLVWRTLDHTRVQMLIDHGEITEEEARTHPEAGMLTRALGHDRMADGRPLEPDVMSEPIWLEAEDTLVLCSDGLHDLVEDWEIGQMVAGRAPEEAAEVLVDAACERGGHDNITVTIITAGARASEYDPNFVPEKPAKNNPRDEYTGEDYDTFDGEDANTYPGTQPPAGASSPPPRAPGSTHTTPITANTGVINPALLAQGAPPRSSNRKWIIAAVLGLLGVMLLVALVVVLIIVFVTVT